MLYHQIHPQERCCHYLCGVRVGAQTCTHTPARWTHEWARGPHRLSGAPASRDGPTHIYENPKSQEWNMGMVKNPAKVAECVTMKNYSKSNAYYIQGASKSTHPYIGWRHLSLGSEHTCALCTMHAITRQAAKDHCLKASLDARLVCALNCSVFTAYPKFSALVETSWFSNRKEDV